MSDTCRSCGAPVRFVPSAKSGKLMILDAAPHAAGNIEITEDGKARVIPKDDLFLTRLAHGGPRYLDHHATCPDVQKYRKPKGKS